MQKSFFIENFKHTKIISCPNCKKEIEIRDENNEVICEDCGECFEIEEEPFFSEDFVWYPNEKY
ncbi:MAG: hypothetical protein QXD43_06075 [Candidatus Aenigmatarchaeota archaeon]